MDSAIVAIIVGGGVTACFVIIQTVIPKIIEQSFQKRFDLEIKRHENNLAGDLERRKNNLAVWSEFRKDLLAEKWEHHKRMVNEMTGVILSFQAAVFDGQSYEDTVQSVNHFRVMVHKSYALIAMDGIQICDDFYQKALDATCKNEYSIAEGDLKKIRTRMVKYNDDLFLADKVMSGIVQETTATA